MVKKDAAGMMWDLNHVTMEEGHEMHAASYEKQWSASSEKDSVHMT